MALNYKIYGVFAPCNLTKFWFISVISSILYCQNSWKSKIK